MRSALLIANDAAGSSTAAAVEQVVRLLADAGVEVEPKTTADAADLDAALDARNDRDLVVAGGDGSLHAVVAALARRGELDGPVIGLIPLGTGNDFARTVGVPLELDQAVAVCAHSSPRPIDLIVDDADGVVVNAVNIGVGAEAGRRASPLKSPFGRVAYVLGAAAAAVSARGLRLRVEADGRVVADGAGKVLQIGLGNGQFVGGGTALAPRALPSDGAVDVVVSFAIGPLRRFGYAVEVKLRRHLDRRDVVGTRASQVRVSGEAYWCSTDGELAGPVSDRTWTVRPGAIRMALPPLDLPGPAA